MLFLTVGKVTLDELLQVLGPATHAGDDNVRLVMDEPLPHTTTVWDVEGMTCTSCCAALESACVAVPGVRSVAVNLLLNSVTINHTSQVCMTRWLLEGSPGPILCRQGSGNAHLTSLPPFPLFPRSRSLFRGQTSVDALRVAIEGAGFGATQRKAANLQTARLLVDGMTCAACVGSLESALRQLLGVAKVW